MRKASRIITQHRLLSRAELTCSFLVLDEATKTTATVTVREKHGGKCGGAPETAPRRFTMEIDLNTGVTRRDNNYPDTGDEACPLMGGVFVFKRTCR